MECPKCQGLMVFQMFSNKCLSIEGWKCINCGKIIEKRENSIRDSSFGVFYQREKIKDQG
jgi:Zn ribbon nucleic-acid-binding protein